MDYLKPEKHSALIRQIQFIAEQTHIPEKYIRSVAAVEFCTDAEMNWLRNAQKHIRDGDGGMILHGAQVHSISKKMMAIGATLTRNFIDSRIFTISSILEMLDDRDSEVPDCTVLLIPDLCIQDYDIPKRLLHKLTGLLLKRFAEGKVTIAYVDNLKKVGDKYGKSFADNLKDHYDLFAVETENTI